MNRIKMNVERWTQIDHINGNGLDNRKCNLRFANANQNQHNRKTNKNNKSGYKGVCWHKRHNKWISRISINNKLIHLGLFNDKLDAANTYNNAAIKYYGEFANLNIIK